MTNAEKSVEEKGKKQKLTSPRDKFIIQRVEEGGGKGEIGGGQDLHLSPSLLPSDHPILGFSICHLPLSPLGARQTKKSFLSTFILIFFSGLG